MDANPQDLRSFGNALPIAAATGISVVLGVSKLLFASQAIIATAAIGPGIGPVSLAALRSVDLAVGLFVFIAGMALIFRRAWGQRLLSHGAIPVAGYELGRALGLAVADVIRSDIAGLAISAVTVACWVLVAWFVRSKAADVYVASRT